MKTLIAAIATGLFATVAVAQAPAPAKAPAVDCKDVKNKDKPECKAPAKK